MTAAAAGGGVRAIFFDAGNTLLSIDYEAIAAQLAILGRPVAAALIQQAEWRARVRLDADLFAAPAPGASTETRDTHTRYLRYVLDGVGVTEEPTIDAVAAWRSTYNAPIGLWNRRDPHAEEALRTARAAGLRTAVISNSNGTIRGLLERLDLVQHVDFVLDSGEEGVEKPSPVIFQRALQRAGVSAGESVYIGDLYSIDVLGARRVGMRPILLDPGNAWGERDCARAATVLEAVRLVVR